MTEYDYSPAAVERYMANQTRVSNWVHGQATHAVDYASPFVPHPSSSNSSSSRDSPLDDYSHDRYDKAYRDYDRDRPSASRRSESSGHRSSVRRSNTTSVTPHTTYRDKHSRSHSQSQVQQLSQYPRTREIYAPPPPPPVTPVTPVSPQQYHTGRAHHHHHHHSQLQTYDPDSYFPPSSSGQRPYQTFTIDPANTREIVLRPPRRGETYVIIPPAGQRIEVVQTGSSSSGGSRSPSRSPTKKNNPPLIKRIFGAIGPTSSGSGSRKERSSY